MKQAIVRAILGVLLAIPLSISASTVASVSIALTSGANPACAGASLTFTATPTNGGTAPTYQWKVGTTNVGTNSRTFTTTTLTTGQVVTCVMTSNLSGVTGSPATSNAITMTIDPVVTPSVSIATPYRTVCAGAAITFTATAINGGTSPSYQWKVGTTNVGTNSPSYTTSALTNGQVVSCIMTSSAACASPAMDTSAAITMTIEPTVAPSVSIATPHDTICAGATATFTATPVNGGTAPSYQWKIGTTIVGTNSPTYATSTLTNGQTVSCIMTSDATCATPASVTSPALNMTIRPTVTPAVTIAAPAYTVCAGSSVTFTATPANGGTAPSYQWRVGTTNVGTNSPTYTTGALTNGQTVSCVMTSSASCPSPVSATSSAVTMTIDPTVTPSVTIATPNHTVCAGTSVTFTATVINGGTSPSYQWKVGTTNVGTNSPTYTTSTLTNGQSVSCVVTSSAACASPATATSAAITMTIDPNGAPSVTISVPDDTICPGSSATFTATPVNGGTAPSYQWKVGSTNVGTNSPTYTTSSLTNGQSVSCVMTSSASCISPAVATSGAIPIIIRSTVTPAVTITTPVTTVCAGTSVTFTATPANGGPSPSYQWMVGTTNVGTNSPTYTTTTLTNGQAVSCVMTSSATCPSPASATSAPITMTINPSVTPAVTIATPYHTICSGVSATFTATPANGGTSPSYQWKVGTTNVGTNSPTYTTTTLTNGQAVSCVMTSSATCPSPATATSAPITMAIGAIVTPGVSISASDTVVCPSATDTFRAVPSNGGPAPVYQWKAGTTDVGTNSSTYISPALTNGEVISCIMTSNASCVSHATDTSNYLTIAITSVVTPAVSIQTPATSVCSGNSVTFSATPTNGGANPSFQWKVGTTNVGTNSPTYTTGTLTNGQAVSCVMTSSAACAAPLTAASNSVTMTVGSQTPSISIGASALPVCSGMADTFTAQVVNAGLIPVFHWRVNGVPVGTNSSSFVSASLQSGDIVNCVLLSSLACALPDSVTSNSITVTGAVTPTITIHVRHDTICQGLADTFSATGTNLGSAPVYQWQVGGIDAGSGTSFITSSLANDDTVTCVVISDAACASPAQAISAPITVGILSTSVTPSGPMLLCAGDSILLTASGGGSQYRWTDSVTGATRWIHHSGTYDIIGGTGTCVAQGATAAIVTVDSPAIPTILKRGYLLTSTPAVSYQWWVNDTISSDTSQTFTITESANYVVITGDSSGCHASSIHYFFHYIDTTHVDTTVSVTTPPDTLHTDTTASGIHSLSSALQVKLYPIPNHGSFMVVASDLSDASLTIYDIYGQALYEQKLTSEHTQVSDEGLQPAIYFVTISDRGRTKTIKMQVIRE